VIPHISLNWRNTRVYFHVSEVDYYSLLIIIESYQNSKNKRSGVNGLDTAKRLQLIRVIEKIEKNPEFSDRLGVKNKSEFRSKEPANKN
jgi:hypothetical protein